MNVFPETFTNDGDLNVSAPNGEVVAPGCSVRIPGLTKRELFAAMAMQGILSHETENYGYTTEAAIAVAAVKHADALLAELAKERP